MTFRIRMCSMVDRGKINQLLLVACVLCLPSLGVAFPKSFPGGIAHIVGSWPSFYPSTTITQDHVAGLVTGGYIREARSVVDDERECLTTERDAFQRFAENVQTLSVSTREMPGAGATTLVETEITERQLEAIRNQYRETVMAVPHYEDDYGEELGANMAAEFTEETALLVTDGTHVSQHVKDVLVQQAFEAVRERETLLKKVEREERALDDSYERLRAIDAGLEVLSQSAVARRSFPELIESERSLREDEAAYERLLYDVNGRFTGRTNT